MLRKIILNLAVILVAINSAYSINYLQSSQSARKNRTKSNQVKSTSNKSVKTKTGEIVKENKRRGSSGKNEKKNQSAKNASRNQKNKESANQNPKTKNLDKAKSQNSSKNRNQAREQTRLINQAKSQVKSQVKNQVKNQVEIMSKSQAPLKFKSSGNSKEDLKINQTNKTFIVKRFSEPLRNAPNLNAQIKRKIKLGTVLNAFQKNADWYFVEQSDELKGWISANSIGMFDETSAEKIYLQIAEESYNRDINFEKAIELADLLDQAIKETKTPTAKAKLELLHLLTVKQALKAFPLDKRESSPYSDFLRANKEIIIYNQPNAKWIIASKAFWDLQRKYSSLPIAEEIAWEASQNPLPGECESDIVCMLFYVRMTKAEYLRLYPDGTKSAEALEEMANLLEEIITKGTFYDSNDSSYKAEFCELLVELEKITSRSNSVKKEKVLQQLKKISGEFIMAN